MNSKIATLVIFFIFSITGCNGQNGNTSMLDKEKDVSIDSITLSYRNIEKFKEIVGDRNIFKIPLKELMLQYESYVIDQKNWDIILEYARTAEYNEGQYDPVRNPNGFMKKVTEPTYVFTIHYADNTKGSIAYWRGGMLSINGRWHTPKYGEAHQRFTLLLKETLNSTASPTSTTD